MASKDGSFSMSQPSSHSTFPSGPPSIISSRMTDIASEDGDEYPPSMSRTQTNRQSLQTAGDGRSRPGTSTTVVSSNRNPWSQAPPSRRGYPAITSQRRNSTQGSIAGSTGRPKSAVSRTHVPSITQQAFFRPMSSQRLQAQRGGSRPAALNQNTASEHSSEGHNVIRRQSQHSNQTTKPGPSIPDDNDLVPPPSRGTEMTEHDISGRITSNASPTYDHPTGSHHQTGSLSESVRPLQGNTSNSKGLSLNVDKAYMNGGNLQTPSKSPRSFRSSFLLPSRADMAPNSPNRSTHGREKLSSIASSPALTPTTSKRNEVPVAKPNLGKNHQYFTGNTRFWWGGRLQNARDRPVNIATGTLVVMPGVLFFIFSAPWLWYNISPAIPIIFAYIFYICLSSFIHASVSDPGVRIQKPQPIFTPLI
jgi:palmitoyltransferase ZDHHC9/14/18